MLAAERAVSIHTSVYVEIQKIPHEQKMMTVMAHKQANKQASKQQSTVPNSMIFPRMMM